MPYRLLDCIVVLVVVGVMTGCESPPRGEQAVIADQVLPLTGEGESFNVDTASSWIRISGKGTDDKQYAATLRLQYGLLQLEGETIKQGTFIIDITSLDRQTEGNAYSADMNARLQNGSAFSPVEFATSSFEITKVVPYTPSAEDKSLVEGANFEVSGNLEVIQLAKNITFPARIELEGERLEGDAKFEIDRRSWAMNYGDDKTLGDQFMGETATIELHVEALRENQAVEFDPL